MTEASWIRNSLWRYCDIESSNAWRYGDSLRDCREDVADSTMTTALVQHRASKLARWELVGELRREPDGSVHLKRYKMNGGE